MTAGHAYGYNSGSVGNVWRSSPGRPLARLASTTGTSFTDNLTGARTTYTYVIKAFDGAANRSGGAQVQVTA